MDPGALDIAHGLNGSLQFAFEGPLVVHLLIKLRLSPGDFVKDLVADPAAVRRIMGRHFEPGGVDLIRGDGDGRAVGADKIRYLFCRQFSGDRLRVGRLEARHQRLVLGRRHHPDKESGDT